MGEGRSSTQITDFLKNQGEKASQLQIEFSGWVDSERVAEIMRDAVFSVASGRGAAQSLAVGTPVVAFGSQGVYGLQDGVNLEHGLWGNFGGYPLGNRVVTEISDDISRVIGDPSSYPGLQARGREAVQAHLLQSAADQRLGEVYRGLHRPRRGIYSRIKRALTGNGATRS